MFCDSKRRRGCYFQEEEGVSPLLQRTTFFWRLLFLALRRIRCFPQPARALLQRETPAPSRIMGFQTRFTINICGNRFNKWRVSSIPPRVNANLQRVKGIAAGESANPRPAKGILGMKKANLRRVKDILRVEKANL
jgi:hypothetical protein